MIPTATRRAAGFDEVGRGCIAGAVIAAAVILSEDAPPIPGLADSKKLTPRKRERLADLIKEQATAWAIGRAEPSEIDTINVLQASLLAMRRAYDALGIRPELGLIDGNRAPNLPCATRTIVGGDDSIPSISAASILAKVYRDREMEIMDALFPGYGFALHKGYPTAAHIAALEEFGPSPVHRRSFAPVQRLSGLMP